MAHTEDHKNREGNQALSYNTTTPEFPKVNNNAFNVAPIQGGLASPSNKDLIPINKNIDVPGMPEGSNFNAAGGGIEALNQLPTIINNFSSKPTSSKEATGKVLSSAASGASIGLAAGGPLGAAIGLGVGATAGLIGNIGWRAKELERQDDVSIAEQEFDVNQRKQDYFLNSSREQIEGQKNLYLKSQGYTV